MNCVVYKGRRRPDTYLFVEQRDEFGRLPQALLDMMGDLTLVLELELDEQRKLAQADVTEVMKSLKDCGFFVQMPPGDNRPHPLDA